MNSFSLRPSRPFFAFFAVTSFCPGSKTKAFNREGREGSAKIAKKGVFLDVQHGL
jgi:hypothetical protein